MTTGKRARGVNHPLVLAAMLLTAIALLLLVSGPLGAQTTRTRADANTRSAGLTSQVTDSAGTVTFNREVFRYDAAGRRDPFVSLIKSSEIRPTISDLRLTTIAYDPQGRSSVAVLRDLGTKEQYRVKVGSPLGRMRVVRIDPKTVTFALEEFGFSRQESLTIGDTTIKGTP